MPDLPVEVDGGLIVRDDSGKPTGNTLNILCIDNKFTLFR